MKYFWEVCSFLFVLYIIIERSACHPCNPDIITKIDTVWKEVPVKSIEYITLHRVDTVYLKKYIYRLSPSQKDSIVIEHLTPLQATRTFEDDTILVNLVDTISENKIQGQKFTYKIKIPFLESKPKNKYFVGVGAIGTNDQVFIAPEISLLTKKQNYLQLRYDPVNKAAGFSFGFKIGKHGQSK